MKYTQLRSVAAISVCVFIVLLGISYVSGQDIWEAKGATADIGETAYLVKAEADIITEADEAAEETSDSTKESGIPQESEMTGLAANIIIPKMLEGIEVTLEDEYINRQLKVNIANAPEGIYQKEMLIYDGKAVKKVAVEYPGKDKTVFVVSLDGVYAYELTEKEDMYVVTLRDIHSVYEKVIVVDAGHGGKDNGCSSPDSKQYEKKITLAVTEELKALLDNTDIKVYYTRLRDETVYLRPRVSLANDVKADMFISLHCNFYEYYYYYKVKGAEALYSSARKKVTGKSKRLSAILLDNMVAETGLSKRSVVDRKKDIHILKKSRVPATIVEMAYLSEAGDLKYISGKNGQKTIAKGLFNGIVETYHTLYNKTIETFENGDNNK